MNDKNNNVDEIVFGRNPVLEIVENSDIQVNKIWISQGLKDRDFRDLVVGYAKQNKVPCNLVPQEKINRLTNNKNNQGIALSISPIDYLTVGELLDELSLPSNKSMILIAHEIEDSHNLGAMVRTLTAASGKGVILTGKSSVGVNANVIKSSVGTIFNARVARHVNCNQVIEKLQDAGYWVIGAANESESQNLYKTDFPKKIAIIMGNEHEGLPSLVKKNCDILVKIPISDHVESLNVSVAFGIVLFEYLRQTDFS